ncbi:uncharacterized protein MELLADRAFT_89696 [Melampsora larici-populina 98AG31]|uniref:Uncharacterized protein n=1 Tax=Melampsora larici-populina (strain 98AG31 / pathotype 3-4-7) TaxID=747676 RepID=F4RUA9_MELLP|nr:uncharacterized protein MELLADRAFT_89696 [Melampsora larici-populina 98AG31]EGG04030.1 hypothetical protein MELLADRAFT_89696 [Melampsora larici-populina 98AG31]
MELGLLTDADQPLPETTLTDDYEVEKPDKVYSFPSTYLNPSFQRSTRPTLNVEDKEDSSRDISKSESASLSVPEIDLHLNPGT